MMMTDDELPKQEERNKVVIPLFSSRNKIVIKVIVNTLIIKKVRKFQVLEFLKSLFKFILLQFITLHYKTI